MGLSLWLYLRNRKNSEAPAWVLKMLLAFRFVCVFLICLFLLRIFARQVKNETEKPLVIFAIDNSASMIQSGDSVLLKKQFLPQLQELSNQLGSDFSTRTLLFGSDARDATSPPDFSEKETDLHELFTTIDNNFSNQNIGALVLVSDGIYNRGSNPVFQAAELQYPVYSVAFGDTTEIKDLLVKKINHNQVAYLGNNFPVEVQIQAKKFAGRDVSVELSRDGKLLAKKNIRIGSDNFTSAPAFTLAADNPGMIRYTARITDLSDDKNKENNVQTFVIDVIDNKEKILLLAKAPHPDVLALKAIITTATSYSLNSVFSGGEKTVLKAYSLVIIHGNGGPELKQLVEECETAQVPYWVVNPHSSDHLPGLKISYNINRTNDAESSFNPAFGLFSCSDELKGFVEELPAVKTFFGNYTLANNAQVLLYQRIGSVETENPLLLFSENNGLKSAVFAGDGLWRWKFRDFAEHGNTLLFKELVSKTIQYLAVKSDKSFFRVNAPRTIFENEALEIEAEVYNKSYELITEPEVTLDLYNEKNNKFNYTFSKNAKAYRLNAGSLAPGTYRYKTSVKTDGQVFSKEGSIVVKEMVAEKINTVADHALLFRISQRSKGKLFFPAQLDSLEQAIYSNEQIKPVTYSQQTTSDLIDLKWLFWLILGLFATEWYVRKRYLAI